MNEYFMAAEAARVLLSCGLGVLLLPGVAGEQARIQSTGVWPEWRGGKGSAWGNASCVLGEASL